MMGSVTRVDSAALLRRLKVLGVLAIVAGVVALLAHAVVVAPKLLDRPSGNQQQLRGAPDDQAPAPESVRKRPLRVRPARA